MNKLTAKKCREQFEEWMTSLPGFELADVERRDDGKYSYSETEWCWKSWQASRESLEIALPVLEQREKGADSEDVFIVMRKPGCMPVIKRPVGEIEEYLTRLYSMNAGAVCDVVIYRYSGVSDQCAQDGRELLAIAEVLLEQQERERGEEE